MRKHRKVGLTEVVIVIVFGLILWKTIQVGKAFAANFSHGATVVKEQLVSCRFPGNSNKSGPFYLVGDDWLKGEFNHYGWVDVRRIGNQIEYQTTYWDGTTGPLFIDVISRGCWHYGIRSQGEYPLEIDLYEFYDPENFGDQIFVSGAGLSWPSTNGVRLR